MLTASWVKGFASKVGVKETWGLTMPVDDSRELNKQLETYKELQERNFRWQGTIIALSSAIFGFVATQFLDAPECLVRIFASISLGVFLGTILYALWRQKTIIERNINTTTGRIKKITGRENEVTSLEKQAADKLNKDRNKTTNFSDYLLWLFTLGLALSGITVGLSMLGSKQGNDARSKKNTLSDQQSAVETTLSAETLKALRDLAETPDGPKPSLLTVPAVAPPSTTPESNPVRNQQ